jgi:hypothetical protein
MGQLSFDYEKPVRIARSIQDSSTGLSIKIYNMIKSFSSEIKHTLGDKNEVCLIFINLIIFMVIQTIFFHFVISKEYEVLLQEKMVTIQYYISNDEDFKAKYLKEKQKIISEEGKEKTQMEIKAEEQMKKRDNINMTLYLYYCIIPIICVLFVFVVIILLIKFPRQLSKTQWRNFALILLIYIPNMIIFFFVVKKYQYIGNIDILSRIYNTLTNKNNINKN